MKKLIKKILREQEEVEGTTGWYYDDVKKTHEKRTNTMDASSFYRAVRYVVENYSEEELNTIMLSPSYDRWEELYQYLKLMGLSNRDVDVSAGDGIPSKILWAAVDNYDKLQDGTIENFGQLYLRPLKKYRVKCSEYARENVNYSWEVVLTAYAEEDAEMTVSENEDGYYSWWEWDRPQDNFDKEVGDVDSDGIEIDSIDEEGPATSPIEQTGDVKEELNEVESPEENDLIDKLRKIMKQWKKEDKENEWYDKIENALKELHIPLKD
jgi:hypothetical protein